MFEACFGFGTESWGFECSGAGGGRRWEGEGDHFLVGEGGLGEFVEEGDFEGDVRMSGWLLEGEDEAVGVFEKGGVPAGVGLL